MPFKWKSKLLVCKFRIRIFFTYLLWLEKQNEYSAERGVSAKIFALTLIMSMWDFGRILECNETFQQRHQCYIDCWQQILDQVYSWRQGLSQKLFPNVYLCSFQVYWRHHWPRTHLPVDITQKCQIYYFSIILFTKKLVPAFFPTYIIDIGTQGKLSLLLKILLTGKKWIFEPLCILDFFVLLHSQFSLLCPVSSQILLIFILILKATTFLYLQ